jgi:hypothetical protein
MAGFENMPLLAEKQKDPDRQKREQEWKRGMVLEQTWKNDDFSVRQELSSPRNAEDVAEAFTVEGVSEKIFPARKEGDSYQDAGYRAALVGMLRDAGIEAIKPETLTGENQTKLRQYAEEFSRLWLSSKGSGKEARDIIDRTRQLLGESDVERGLKKVA